MFQRLLLSLSLLFGGHGIAAGDYTEDVVLSIWQDCYPPGEWVWFTVANNGDSAIGNPGSPPWKVYRLEDGSLVWPPGETLPDPWSLPPHTARDYFWDQTGMGGEQVQEGFYEIVLPYGVGGSWYTARDTVEINGQCPPTAVERHSWGSLKNLFR